MAYMIQLVTAFLGSLGFAMLFNIKRGKLLAAASGGLLAWGGYLLATIWVSSELICYFLASIILTFYAEAFARIKKAPATIFLVSASIPLIPGGSLYYTMSHAVSGEWDLFARQGIDTLLLAIAIAIGMLCGLSVLKTLDYIRTIFQKNK